MPEGNPMDPTRQRTGSIAAKVAIAVLAVLAVLAGLVVLVLLFPASGVDTQPPECFSVFGYSVPCGGGVAVAAGAAVAAVIGVLFWIAGRGRGKG